MNKTAVVTGASSGIGYAITSKLLKDGYTVFGFGRTVAKDTFSETGWNPVTCDLLDSKQLQESCYRVLVQTGNRLDVLVLSAGMARFGPHETHQEKEIAEMADLNFKAPLLLINRFLRAVRDSQGHIIAIGSVTGKINSPQGGVYAATKAGMHHFLKLLFDETRKSGVKITEIVADLTRTPFYDHLNFEPESNPEAHLNPQDVAESVMYAVNHPQGVVTEIELRPQKLQVRKKNTN